MRLLTEAEFAVVLLAASNTIVNTARAVYADEMDIHPSPLAMEDSFEGFCDEAFADYIEKPEQFQKAVTVERLFQVPDNEPLDELIPGVKGLELWLESNKISFTDLELSTSRESWDFIRSYLSAQGLGLEYQSNQLTIVQLDTKPKESEMDTLIAKRVSLEVQVNELMDKRGMHSNTPMEVLYINQVNTVAREIDRVVKHIHELEQKEALDDHGRMEEIVAIVKGTLDFIVGDESVSSEVSRLLTNDVIALVGLHYTYAVMDYIAGRDCSQAIRGMNAENFRVYVPSVDDLERLQESFLQLKVSKC